MLSPPDTSNAHGVGTHDWVATWPDMRIGTYVPPVSALGSAALSTADVSLAPLVPPIDDAEHRAFLEESLREYRDIWQHLADR